MDAGRRNSGVGFLHAFAIASWFRERSNGGDARSQQELSWHCVCGALLNPSAHGAELVRSIIGILLSWNPGIPDDSGTKHKKKSAVESLGDYWSKYFGDSMRGLYSKSMHAFGFWKGTWCFSASGSHQNHFPDLLHCLSSKLSRW